MVVVAGVDGDVSGVSLAIVRDIVQINAFPVLQLDKARGFRVDKVDKEEVEGASVLGSGTGLGQSSSTTALSSNGDWHEKLLEGDSLKRMMGEEDERVRIEGNPVGSLKRHLEDWRELGCSPITLDWIEKVCH